MRKALAALLLFAVPALAEAQAPRAPAAPAAPVARPAAAAPAARNVDTTSPLQTYDTDLGGLAKTLGGMHYIRILCAGRGDQKWRSQMAQVMNLEGPPGTPRRVIMSQEFNTGYREQEERFTVCSPDAQASEKTLMAQGARISQALGARHRD